MTNMQLPLASIDTSTSAQTVWEVHGATTSEQVSAHRYIILSLTPCLRNSPRFKHYLTAFASLLVLPDTNIRIEVHTKPHPHFIRTHAHNSISLLLHSRQEVSA